jgi:hypothetical protein
MRLIQEYNSAHPKAVTNGNEILYCPICCQTLEGRKKAGYHLNKRSVCGKVYYDWLEQIDSTPELILNKVATKENFFSSFF